MTKKKWELTNKGNSRGKGSGSGRFRVGKNEVEKVVREMKRSKAPVENGLFAEMLIEGWDMAKGHLVRL